MADLRNIALTEESARQVAELKDRLGFAELADVVRLGFAYAVTHGVPLLGEQLGPRRGTNYDTGGLDQDGMLAQIVRIFYEEWPDDEPYRAVEILMNRGVGLLGEHWQQGVIGSLSDLVELERTHL
ncbi:hypothetical protein [Cellulomonas soli]